MNTLIKICGLSTPETVAAAIEAGASHIGLNFYKPSPRYVAPNEARNLAASTENRIQKVGIFVDAGDDLLEQALTAGSLDILQFHGNESPQRVADARARFGIPIWRVLSIETAKDIARADQYDEVADFLLFDTKTPKGDLPGGMGMGFDWGLLEAYKGPLPWGLAGGLTPTNVAEAIRQTGTSLVDTSSGVESAPGVKDVDRIAAFCKAAHSV